MACRSMEWAAWYGLRIIRMTRTSIEPLEVHARQVLSRVRSAFGAVLTALPERAQRPHEVQKSLQIDSKLGWAVSRLVHEEDLYLAAQQLPGRRRLETFLKAASKRAIPDELLARVRAAVEEFEELVEVHAGDRASLEVMLLGCSARANEDAILAQRKAAFQANSFIWGVQARTQFGIYFLRPGREAAWGDIAGVRGFVGLRRMRPDVPWVISRLHASDETGQAIGGFDREPLGEEVATTDGSNGVALLTEFCSRPLPALRRVEHSPGFIEEVLEPAEVGNTGAIDIVTGDDARGVVPRRAMDGEKVWGGLRMLRTPVETLVLDQLVHVDMYGPIVPRLIHFSDLTLARGFPTPPLSESDQLPTPEVVQYLGRDPTAVYTPDVPRYTKIIERVCARIQCEPSQFDVYRVRMSYPAIPTSIGMEHDLPEQAYRTSEA
jgi:hypothetical protein